MFDWSPFRAFTVVDGAVGGAWLAWAAMLFRAEANAWWAARRRGRGVEVSGRWIAVALMAGGGGLFLLGWMLDSEGGPTAWTVVFLGCWLIGWLGVRAWRR